MSGETLQGRRVLVTGASAGVGLEIAQQCAALGADVVGVARRRPSLEGTGATHGIVADLGVPGQAEAAVRQATDLLGGLDVLVNNAAQYLVGGIDDGDPDDWRRMFEVNVLAVLTTVKVALPWLREGTGDIVNVGSLAGHRLARPSTAVYAATKHALRAITEGMRQEFASADLRVMMVSPGLIHTDLGVGTRDEGQLEEIRQLQRDIGLDASDVAAAVVNVLSLPRTMSVRDLLITPSGQTA
jgi:NADP-dependent 3-hydroxy acid dehydrogenase YdfG